MTGVNDAKKAKLLRQLAAARLHLKECPDPIRRALMQKNIVSKEQQLERLTLPATSSVSFLSP